MTPPTVQLSARPPAGVRCAFCHGPLLPADEQVACPRCDSRLHADCVVAARCPTLFCGHRFRTASLAPANGTLQQLGFVVAVLLPALCFVMNEANHGLIADCLPEVYEAPAQRPLYPLLTWAVLAYAGAASGYRAAWIRVGLWGGTLLAGLFSLLYVAVLPYAVIGILFLGLGLLGFAPYPVLLAYAYAARAYERGPPAKSGRAHLALAGAWVALFVVALLAGRAIADDLPGRGGFRW